MAGQAIEFGAVGDVQAEVVQAQGEARPGIGVEVLAGDLRAAVAFHQSLVFGAVVVLTGHRDDPHLVVQTPLAVQVVERRQQLVEGQVAGTAKDQHVAGSSHCDLRNGM